MIGVRRSRAFRLPASLLAPALLASGLASCSAAVHVDPASTSGACAALVAALPSELAGAKTREVSPRGSGTAAWGKPPITLRCGVLKPSGAAVGTGMVVVDGVAWLPEELTHGYRFTVETAAGYVQVDVPAAYSPAAGVLVDLGPAMRSAGAKG